MPQLTVAQNMVLGRERAFNSVRRVRNTARQALQRLNFNVDPTQRAGSLSAAKRQMVEIARAVLNDARVIIFDEPTAALTPEETEHLFELMRRCASAASRSSSSRTRWRRRWATPTASPCCATAGCGDRSGGRIRSRQPHSPHDRRGACGAPRAPTEPRRTHTATPMLRVENVRMGAMVNNMSFSMFPGEVTGLAGLIGSGRSEVAKVVMGHTKRNFGGGRIWLNGRRCATARRRRRSLTASPMSARTASSTASSTRSASPTISGCGWLAKFGRGR